MYTTGPASEPVPEQEEPKNFLDKILDPIIDGVVKQLTPVEDGYLRKLEMICETTGSTACYVELDAYRKATQNAEGENTLRQRSGL